jgi:hypothetical protein
LFFSLCEDIHTSEFQATTHSYLNTFSFNEDIHTIFFSARKSIPKQNFRQQCTANSICSPFSENMHTTLIYLLDSMGPIHSNPSKGYIRHINLKLEYNISV